MYQGILMDMVQFIPIFRKLLYGRVLPWILLDIYMSLGIWTRDNEWVTRNREPEDLHGKWRSMKT